ncbi:MAG: lysophospholipid acyltransferase family protein [Eubacteriales bacterium]
MKDFDFSRVREYKLATNMKPFVRFLTKLLMKIKYVGIENIPSEGGFILASNHISAPDPAYLFVILKKPVHFMNKQEHFKKPIQKWVYTHFNSFPINRGHADKSSLEYSIKVIEKGNVLGIFPEGTRSKDFTPKQARPGVALLVRETKANVLPVSIYSEDKAKFFTKLTIRFGKPIPFESLGFSEGGKSDELRMASQLIMDEIVKLWEEGHCK